MLKCVRELPGFYLVAVAADSFACRGHWSTRISGAALSLSLAARNPRTSEGGGGGSGGGCRTARLLIV